MSFLDRREMLKLGALPLAGWKSSARNVIFLKLTGGPSQLDTFDPKPDAPSGVRSPFKPLRTNVPGMEISELFPRLAKQADQYALIRGCYHTAEPVHEAPPELVPGGVSLRGGTFAENCARALRLIESGGGRSITVHMFDSVFNQPSWDAHGFGPFSGLDAYRDHVAPLFDIACSKLLANLDARGLLSSTLVVAAGEFGRTPKINMAGGRDHWPECFTTLMAGGGVRGGQIIGSSDKIAAEPKDRPVSADEIASTIRHALCLPPAGAEPVLELFG